MQVIEYRDKDGFLIVRYDTERKLIYCPETKGLKHTGVCEKCEYFIAYGADGIKCGSEQPNNPPKYYDRIK